MPVRLSGHPDIVKDPAKALKSCFLAINKALRSLPNNAAIYSGSTAVVALVRDGKMWVANAGDSRAILVVEGGAEGQAVKGTHPPMRVVPLTTDHDPDLPTEKARIVASGGFVSAPAEPGLSARVWLDPEHTQIGLAMARSLGDLAVKTVGVIAEPEVLEHTIQPTDRFMVMASDGVWEFLTSTDVAAFAHEHLAKGGNAAAKSACEALIARAANMWRAHEGQYRDDITAQILMLPCFGTSSSSA
ncbi:phosphatase 2C-like domain-containing protein [Tribonema minus]|uniref:Phosphatase 2C-like domain-containing protein n=1 Tax=Tribonema minus TaxID=303371 RepID=A0A835YWR4_9STRA|nr:phosphatase 2C-like domain-containing protein [Tribonema minus]